MTQARTQVWVMATALSALATAGLIKTGARFDSNQLASWTAGQLKPKQRNNATSQMIKAGLLQFDQRKGEQLGETVVHYQLTAEGAQAVKAASEGYVRKSGPKGERAPNPIDPQSLTARLWRLVKMRRIVDTDSATETLANAGEGDFKSMRHTVAKYLRRWCDAGALTESAKRVPGKGSSNGFKRYVLREDWRNSAEPPRWRQIAKAQAAASNSEATS
ncbi:hypothetical protein ACFJGW_00670 [Burkholderiaceae bacterium UC74_6]